MIFLVEQFTWNENSYHWMQFRIVIVIIIIYIFFMLYVTKLVMKSLKNICKLIKIKQKISAIHHIE